jgi:hypothetical protein
MFCHDNRFIFEKLLRWDMSEGRRICRTIENDTLPLWLSPPTIAMNVSAVDLFHRREYEEYACSKYELRRKPSGEITIDIHYSVDTTHNLFATSREAKHRLKPVTFIPGATFISLWKACEKLEL